MEIDNLEDSNEWIGQTENGQVEFKETTGQWERGMETNISDYAIYELFGINTERK